MTGVGVLPLEDLQAGAAGPLYLRLMRLIEAAVASGRLRHGEALPAERDIADAAEISRVTVRKAIDALVAQGLLARRRGSGTYVVNLAPRMQQPLRRLTSFSEDMRQRGMVPGSHWVARGMFSPSPQETMVLGLSGTARVARLIRLRTADQKPIALERTSLPDDILPAPEGVEESLYQTLRARGIEAVRANQRISAVLLTSDEAALLGVSAGSAALSVQRIAYLATGRVMEVSTALYRSDVYDLVAELTLDPPQSEEKEW